MIIAKGSPLSLLPDDIHPKLRILFDGIRYAIYMADAAYNNLDHFLTVYLRCNKSIKTSALVNIFSNSWTIVDSVQRVRHILKTIPEIKDLNQVVEFCEKMTPIYNLRAGIQHLPGKAQKLISDRCSTWGAVRWVTTEKIHSDNTLTTHFAAAGSIDEFSDKFLENPLGKVINPEKLNQLVSLFAHGEIIYFEPVLEELQVLTAWLEQYVQAKYDTSASLGSDLYMAADVVFEA
ncbi:hypothetical protein [Microbulbifer sp. JTAC008]|uniref:hypothetical protein n=1 Tax=Microbulbifer sp. JTAC008 TaxID=3243374 RepID=UPI004039F6B5